MSSSALSDSTVSSTNDAIVPNRRTHSVKERLMAVQAQGWERRLIDLAHEALEGQIAAALHSSSDDRALATAYKLASRSPRPTAAPFTWPRGCCSVTSGTHRRALRVLPFMRQYRRRARWRQRSTRRLERLARPTARSQPGYQQSGRAGLGRHTHTLPHPVALRRTADRRRSAT